MATETAEGMAHWTDEQGRFQWKCVCGVGNWYSSRARRDTESALHSDWCRRKRALDAIATSVHAWENDTVADELTKLGYEPLP